MSDVSAVEVALDNDVVLKAACYGFAQRFWVRRGENPSPAVLGTARFVLTHAITYGGRVRDIESATRALDEFLACATVLEPSDEELGTAAELEQLAQRAGLELDIGESQLAAIAANRGIASLDTGDKRAVRGLEALIDHSRTCALLCGRVRCLEQLLARAINDTPHELDAIAQAVCAEPDVDITASICFSCYSDAALRLSEVIACFESYIAALRAQAPRVLAG